MKKNRFPKGWTNEKVRRVISHYERQTEEEALAEDEAVFSDPTKDRYRSSQRITPSYSRDDRETSIQQQVKLVCAKRSIKT